MPCGWENPAQDASQSYYPLDLTSHCGCIRGLKNKWGEFSNTTKHLYFTAAAETGASTWVWSSWTSLVHFSTTWIGKQGPSDPLVRREPWKHYLLGPWEETNTPTQKGRLGSGCSFTLAEHLQFALWIAIKESRRLGLWEAQPVVTNTFPWQAGRRALLQTIRSYGKAEDPIIQTASGWGKRQQTYPSVHYLLWQGFQSKEFMNFYLCDNIIPYKLIQVILWFKKYSTMLIYIIGKVLLTSFGDKYNPGILNLLYTVLSLHLGHKCGTTVLSDLHNLYHAHIAPKLWHSTFLEKKSTFLKFHLTRKNF